MSIPLRAVEPSEPDTNVLRVPPHNYDAERALVGAILMNNRAFERVSDFLLPLHFADPVNGRIFDACSRLIANGQPANPVTLKTYLERDDLIIAAGGIKYLATLATAAVTVINSGDYGKLIHDLFLRRELIAIGEDMVNDAFDSSPDETAADQVEQVEGRLFELVEPGGTGGGLQDFSVAIHEALRIADVAHRRRGALVGVTTGLRDLDHKLAGLHPTDLIIIAGRPSMGKTALASGIATAAATYFQTTARTEDRGKFVAFFSLEMSKEQLGTRLTAQRANVDSHKVRAGHLSDEEFEKLCVAGNEISSLPMKIDDTPAATVGAIRARARRLIRRSSQIADNSGLGLIVIDYLQLISPHGRERPENRVQEISAMTRALKAMAKDLNVPVIALSQLSRAVEQREDKRPQLSDLRESGTIEQDSDIVMFVYREQYYLERSEPSDASKWADWRARMDEVENIAEIIVAKQRHGPIGTVRTHFEASLTAFSDLERKHQDDGHPARHRGTDEGGPPPGHPAAEQIPMDLI